MERKIKTTIFLSLLVACGAETRMINESCYGGFKNAKKEVLKNDISSPYQLAIDYDTNTLFFSYTREDSEKSTFESAYINLKTNEFNIIKGIKGGFANAIDQENHIVYLGGENGIYKFDYKTNLAKHIDGTSGKIWQMFFKKYLYYTTYPEEEVYIFKNGQSYKVPQLSHTRGMLIAIDNADNIYFSNSSGLFICADISNITNIGDYNINGFTSDVNGNLFFSTPNGIYAIDSNNKSVKQLVLIDDIYGVAVEHNGNIIYASEDSIVRLEPTKTQR
ncbi:ommochrome-binding protein-like [Maniola jurtina]|uniref:ommochrome-binding protein-like n=1 Tax=Maniola jurtina TaxID=191418 RepID=UPI001E689676|nr:ommochrome-binding protein-like [Maniola jurtina]